MVKQKPGIKPISQLFGKYKTILIPPKNSVIQVTCEVISDLLDIKINKQQIDYQTQERLIFLKFGGVLRSEIKLNKSEIIRHLKGRLGEKRAPVDIV